MKLFNYFRSSAAYRVRIALNLKNLPYDNTFVHLTRNGGEQFGEAFRTINPQGLVPALDDDGVIVTQSLAMMEYLDEKYGGHALLPPLQQPVDRARVRALSLTICCDIHPLNNLRVLKAITGDLGASETKKMEWIAKWIHAGFEAIEAALGHSPKTGVFCHGDSPTMADCCLVPQVFSARRFNIDLSPYPTITRIDATCNTNPAFIAAQPKNQPDFEA